MESIEYIYEQLEKMEAGKMSAEERKNFMEKYHTDENFRKQVHFRFTAQKVLLEQAAEKRKEMNEWYEEAEKSSRFRKKIAYGIAASLILMVGSWFFFTANSTNCVENITQEYAATLQIDATTMGMKKPSVGEVENSDLKQIAEFYKQGKYAEAIQVATPLQNNAEIKPQILLYLALSELNLKHSDKALTFLDEYKNTLSESAQKDSEIKWWQLMAYYQKGEKAKARELANEILQQNLKHQKEVKELQPCLD